MEERISYTPYVIKYSFFVAIALIVYFLIMSLVGFLTDFHLRYLNFFILLAGIYFAKKRYIEAKKGQLEYLEGLLLGSFISAGAGLIFGMFVFFYLSYLNIDFMNYLREHAPFGDYLTPASAAFVIMMEAAASGAIISFIFMQLWKKKLPQQENI